MTASTISQKKRGRGRPPLPPEQKKEYLTIALTPASHDFLEKQATAQDKSKGELVEALLQGYKQQVANPTQLSLDLSRIAS